MNATQPQHALTLVRPDELEDRLVIHVRGDMGAAHASADDPVRVCCQIADPKPPAEVRAVRDIEPRSISLVHNEPLRHQGLYGSPDVLFAELVNLWYKICASGREDSACARRTPFIRSMLCSTAWEKTRSMLCSTACRTALEESQASLFALEPGCKRTYPPFECRITRSRRGLPLRLGSTVPSINSAVKDTTPGPTIAPAFLCLAMYTFQFFYWAVRSACTQAACTPEKRFVQ